MFFRELSLYLHQKYKNMEKLIFYKNNAADKIWWVDNAKDEKGVFLFSFDKKKVYNLFSDYPWKLTSEEKAIFDKENPSWADFFKDRK